MLSERKKIVYRYEDGGTGYFSVSHFLAGARLTVLQQINSDLTEEKVSWLNSLGRRLDEADTYEIGVREAPSNNRQYLTESVLVSTVINAHRSKDWEDEWQLHLDVLAGTVVPYVPLFCYLTILEPDTRPIASDGSWLVARANELCLSCLNFKAAESILGLASAVLDPLETPFRYVIPEPEVPVFIRDLLILIDRSDKSEQISTYRELLKFEKERHLIQDKHIRESFEDDHLT